MNLSKIALIILILCAISADNSVIGQDDIVSYTFTKDENLKIRLKDSLNIFIDKKGQFDINDILNSTVVHFSKPPNKNNSESDDSAVVWSRVRLTNEGMNPQFRYFSLLTFIDSIWVYTIQDEKILDEKHAGIAYKPMDKELLTTYNNVSFTLDPRTSKDYYFKMKYDSQYDFAHNNGILSMISMIDAFHLNKKYLLKFAHQFFYAGIMILFSFLSLFMFYTFRERGFIVFSFLLLSYAAYFLAKFHILETIFNYSPSKNISLLMQISTAGIVITTSLFFSTFLRVKEHFPKSYLPYLLYGFITASFPFIAVYIVKLDLFVAVNYSNSLVISWILVMMIPLFILTKKKDKSARILLLSTGILILFAIIYLLDVNGFFPPNNWTSYSFQFGTLIFTGILFYRLLNSINIIKNEKKHFEELDQMKSRFFANISHEFRTPLTLVMGPLKNAIQELENPKTVKSLTVAHQNAERLLQLINQILDLSKLEAKEMKLKAEKLNFATLLKGLVMSFESLAAQKNMQLHFVAQNEEIPLYVDQEKIEIIFYNLLSNAFKFTEENGEISVMITEQKNHIEILIRDNGVGIPQDRLDNIFDRYFHVDRSKIHQQEGTGIGLALVKELIALHLGKITVNSQVGEGTNFIIELLKGKKHFTENEIIKQTNNRPTSKTFTPLIELKPNKKSTKLDQHLQAHPQDSEANPTVLVVEDHIDVRMYIKEHLEDNYHILEARNGEEGIELAIKHMPDLIISDVMMPIKNGYELCAILKKDQRTSHIPVILLTAKAGLKEKIEGLTTGADDYLIKPFDTKELEIRVHNLITSRILLRQRFSTQNALDFTPKTANSVDDAFMKKVMDIIQSNLDNTQFGVEVLANEIGFSKAHLNRKLNALCDLSTNKLIQHYRLLQAHQLLQQKVGNVSEIAERTGFNSTSYFVKCFREKYKKTPGMVLTE